MGQSHPSPRFIDVGGNLESLFPVESLAVHHPGGIGKEHNLAFLPVPERRALVEAPAMPHRGNVDGVSDEERSGESEDLDYQVGDEGLTSRLGGSSHSRSVAWRCRPV